MRARAAFAAVALCAGGCGRFEGGSTSAPVGGAGADPAAIAAVPLGDVVGGRAPAGAAIANPYEGHAEAVAEGRTLFVRMNCAGCHGYDATGGMGPNLSDGYWRYGGTPVQLFKSIYEGRPQGMPAWNPVLPPEEIWKLVSYLQSLGGTYPAGGLAASIAGDTPKTQYAPEVQRLLPPHADRPAEAKPSGEAAAPQARPDAGGRP